MQATALTLSLEGLDAHPVRVEVESARGPAAFQLVGLAEASVRESRVRVRSALQQLGVDLDEYAMVVNLAPADLRKSGGAFDVAIATGALAAIGRVRAEALDATALLGELSLTGAVRPVRGVLPALRAAATRGIARAIVPQANAREAASVPGIHVWVAEHLEQIAAHFAERAELPTARAPAGAPPRPHATIDLADVRGQSCARRGLEVAAAGAHNLLFVGPPGSGKTMLARRIPTVMPPMTFDEAVEVTAIHSVAGLLPPDQGVVTARPFRAPHHTVSAAGLVGGGDPVRPGEVSLAHHGCLFLDELFEFRRAAIEALRQPLEDGHVSICRAHARVSFPARPMLVGAVNPCPCGFSGDKTNRCSCSHERVAAYRNRMSGPLLDRIDLHVSLAPVEIAHLRSTTPGESSAAVRERVVRARAIQAARRSSGEVAAHANAELSPAELDRIARPDEAGLQLLAGAVERMGLSARAYGRVLRVARTIADLEGDTAVRSSHVSEAMQLRMLDRAVGPEYERTKD